MKPSQVALSALVALTVLPSLAQTATAPAPAPEPEFTFTGNLGIASDYRFRGVSQTNKNPAIQGGVDFSHKSGFYLGNWNSNVDSAQYNGANIEMDFYGGWKGTFGDFGVDVGGLYYYYPGSGAGGTNKIDNFELYVAGSWGPLTLKYNYATTDFFGYADSSGAYYVSLAGVHDFGNGFGVNASVGYQGGLKNGARIFDINGSVYDSITDWKIGGTYTIDGWVLGLAYIGTNRDIAGFTDPTKNISNGTALVSVTKSF